MDDLDLPVLKLSPYAGDEKGRRKFEAMQGREALIYSARITADELLGDPDLLRCERVGYVARDIKTNPGEYDDEDNAELKKHYGVQLTLYTDIMKRRGLGTSRRPFV